MAGKNQKKASDDPVEKIVDDVADRIDEDRTRISGYLTNLIDAVTQIGDPLTIVGAADSVAKLSDALTRQNALRVETLKVMARRSPAKAQADNTDGVFDEIGRPFDDEEKGSN